MADPTTDTPAKTPDAPLPAAPQAGANVDASTKGAAEVYNPPGGTATPSDAVKPATDTSHAAADTGSSFDNIANIASQAWDSTASALSSWAKSTTDVASADFLDLTSGLFSSTASDQPVAAPPAADRPVAAPPAADQPVAAPPAADQPVAAPPSADQPVAAPPAGDHPVVAPPAGDHPVAVPAVNETAPAKGSSVAVKDGQVTVNNDKVTATHDADGKDVVSEKGKGEVVTRDAKTGEIHDVTADRDTTITRDHIDDKMAGMHIRRETTKPLPADLADLKPGDAIQGSNGIAYKATSFSDSEGGGTAIAGTDGTITLKGKNGDTLVLNADKRDVDFTEKGGQTQHMTLDQFEQKYGKHDFADFHLDGNGQVSSTKDGVVIKAKKEGDEPGKASLVKTNPNGGDVAKASVSADGTSDLKHIDPQGNVLSQSKVNYHDPAHAYQQVDSQGNVTANYDLDDDTFQGDGFAFNDSGMQITDGNVFVSDSGGFTADSSDTISSDGSVYYSSSDDSGLSVTASQLSGLAPDDQVDVVSQLPTATTDVSTAMATGDVGQLAGAADELIALNDLTGGKLNLSGTISQVEAREDGALARADRKANKDVVDFGAGSDLYGTSAA